jgi:hypothetical protein
MVLVRGGRELPRKGLAELAARFATCLQAAFFKA